MIEGRVSHHAFSCKDCIVNNHSEDELPPIIQEFIKKLSKKIDKALEFTKEKNITKTNNLVELLFKVTFPGKIKRIYRTYAGAIMQIKLDGLKWIERNSFKNSRKNKSIS